jgi:hypothetical protein
MFCESEERKIERVYQAIEEDDKKTLAQLFDKYPVVKSHINDFMMFALRSNSKNSIMIILDNGWNPDAIINENKETLLFWAIREKDIALLNDLLQRGTDINHVSRNGTSPFCLAISIFDEIDLYRFNAYDIDFSYRAIGQGNSSYFTLLLSRRYYGVLEYMIENERFLQALFSDKNFTGGLILNWKDGAEVIADILYEKGLKLDDEQPLLQLAVSTVNYDSVKWLLDHGVDPTYEYLDADGTGSWFRGTPLDVTRLTLKRISKVRANSGNMDYNKGYYERMSRQMSIIVDLLNERIQSRGVNVFER